MATYVVGDVQGCFEPLRRLLAKIAFRPNSDRLVLAGDLVNRGPDSLGVLRFALEHESAVAAVLGNHDLHFLGRAADVRTAGRRDTLDALLDAPDRDQLIDWLRRQPLLRRESGWLVVHAGLLPGWTTEDAFRRAAAAEAVLQAPDWKAQLVRLWGPGPKPEDDEVRETFAVLTRLRAVDGRLQADLRFKRGPDELPPGHVAWFEAPGRRTAEERIAFGHWASLGYYHQPGVYALDSGCVWGGSLTALRLDRGAAAARAVSVRCG